MSTTSVSLPSTELARTKQQILSILPPLKSEVATLVIETEDDYQRADGLLTRIMTSKRFWLKGDPTGKWKGIDAIIKPFREGLDGLYDLKNDGLKPHTLMEADVKEKMRAFKIREVQEIAEANRVRDEAAAKLQREIDAKQSRVDAAKTPKMREKLMGQQMDLEQQRKSVTRETSAPVKAAGSATRRTRTPVVKDFYALVAGIIAINSVNTSTDNETAIPIDLLQVNTARLMQLWKDNPELVAQLPGVEIEDDIIIAGR